MSHHVASLPGTGGGSDRPVHIQRRLPGREPRRTSGESNTCSQDEGRLRALCPTSRGREPGELVTPGDKPGHTRCTAMAPGTPATCLAGWPGHGRSLVHIPGQTGNRTGASPTAGTCTRPSQRDRVPAPARARPGEPVSHTSTATPTVSNQHPKWRTATYCPASPSPAISESATAIARPSALRIFPPAETTRATTGATAITTPWMSSAVTPLPPVASALAR
jgi:hypothetical protein